MGNNDKTELGMLTAALQSAVTYRGQDPDELFTISETITKWAHADEAGRREIYNAWRNKPVSKSSLD